MVEVGVVLQLLVALNREALVVERRKGVVISSTCYSNKSNSNVISIFGRRYRISWSVVVTDIK